MKRPRFAKLAFATICVSLAALYFAARPLSYERLDPYQGCLEAICVGDSADTLIEKFLSLRLQSNDELFARSAKGFEVGQSVAVPQQREHLVHYTPRKKQNWLIIKYTSFARRQFWHVTVRDGEVTKIARTTYGPFYIDL